MPSMIAVIPSMTSALLVTSIVTWPVSPGATVRWLSWRSVFMTARRSFESNSTVGRNGGHQRRFAFEDDLVAFAGTEEELSQGVDLGDVAR